MSKIENCHIFTKPNVGCTVVVTQPFLGRYRISCTVIDSSLYLESIQILLGDHGFIAMDIETSYSMIAFPEEIYAIVSPKQVVD